ncbi:MAG: LytTR family transcriptional regulator DNA-binding domain-containing protein [Bacteroidales bacterium]|nr:LytTR family transcriptional regulator DNA-binding domain-containing protein [Bacteroidales bacterium]
MSKLNNPYPCNLSIKDNIKTISFIGLFVFLFVLLFRADQLTNGAGWFEKIKISFFYGSIAFFVPLINVIVITIFISPKKEQNWTVFKEILVYLLHFATISLANYFLSSYLTGSEKTFSNFLQSVIITTAIGAIPVSIFVISNQNKLLKQHLQEAKEITDNQLNRQQKAEKKEQLKINENEFISVSDILFVESDKNYIKILFSNQIETKIRCTVKEFEEKTEEFSNLMRIHRAYIVNLNKIEKVEGNSQGLKLHIHENIIPVSRSFIASFRERYKQ